MSWTTILRSPVGVKNNEIPEPGKRADHSKKIKNKASPNSGMRNARKSKADSVIKFNSDKLPLDGVDGSEVPSDELLKFMDMTLESHDSIQESRSTKTRTPRSPRSARKYESKKTNIIFSPSPQKAIATLKEALRKNDSAGELLRGSDGDHAEDDFVKKEIEKIPATAVRSVKFADVRTEEGNKQANSKPQDLPTAPDFAKTSEQAGNPENRRARFINRRQANKPEVQVTPTRQSKRKKDNPTLDFPLKVPGPAANAGATDSLEGDNARGSQRSPSLRQLAKKYSKKVLRQVAAGIDRIHAGFDGASNTDFMLTGESTQIRVYPHAKKMTSNRTFSADSAAHQEAEDATSAKGSGISGHSESGDGTWEVDEFLDNFKANSVGVDSENSTSEIQDELNLRVQNELDDINKFLAAYEESKSSVGEYLPRNEPLASTAKEVEQAVEQWDKLFPESPAKDSGKRNLGEAPDGLEALSQELKKQAEEGGKLSSKPDGKAWRQGYLRSRQEQQIAVNLNTKNYMDEVDKQLTQAEESLRAEAGEKNDTDRSASDSQ